MPYAPPTGLDSPLVTGTAISTRLLVLALEQADGTVRAQQLYDVAAGLAMSDQQVRLCVRRMVHDGFYTATGRGRGAMLHATGKPRTLALPESAWSALAHAQDTGQAPWDGTWRLYLLAVPERVRHVRDQLRVRLAQLGAAALTGGVYVSPHHLVPELADLVDRLDATPYLTTASTTDLEIAGQRDPHALAAELWPLAQLDEAYRQLRHHTTSPVLAELDRTPPDTDSATGLALTVLVRAARVMQDDPLLPAELLPPGWAGRQARIDLDGIADRLAPALRRTAPTALRLLTGETAWTTR